MPKYLEEVTSDIYNQMRIYTVVDIKPILNAWLQEWIEEFKKRAGGQSGEVRTCDFKKNDFFFYTNCQDIEQRLQNKEITQQECDALERTRKMNVFIQLFLKELLSGKTIETKMKDTHCGSENMIIFGLGLAGAVTYCPDCGRVVIDTTVAEMDAAREILIKKLKEREEIKDV